ncbi:MULTISPECIES: hypothetical protein [unclassified Streptomyces]|uniref:hypothetical protein n=1 Tax=Streptomyces sp. SID4945 TaxID=2690285 RepID=UPI000B84F78E|nr:MULTISPECIES: hypothetical protein [unclassified Streptomyces]
MQLPPPAGLTQSQRRGAACIWCAAALRPGHGDVDLGRQWDTALGIAWFPRACFSCRGREGGQ